MANTAKPIRKAAKTAVAATKEEMKKPSVTAKGSPLQTKSGKSFVKALPTDKKNYMGKKVVKTVTKAEKKSK
ncbi:hypothetical protein UFOVP325_129 [uncultured Caudovirales phage]|uniref:Uncharacterized protein n=1 Tax=uncultured Caudovirales phage TaxID=2100421 RepID=A0A6J5MWW8_9CAUD|nr:hypothetical protein UFOVP325_129 [uncultured Caudovirales phage]CAB4148149.1 hypothetical protein UFOVP430_124 [uncultured Caudovirales phage]